MEEDDAHRNRITAENGLEAYCFQMKSTMEDDKMSEEDKKTILDKVTETLTWLDNNQTAEKDEYEHQQKELEGICNPIITKLYQAAGGAPGGMPGAGGMPGGMPGGAGAPPPGAGGAGPTIEEVD